jgi:hypothetical protein
MSEPAPPPRKPAAPRKPRDPRLDFFRGLAMFIILLAHTPGNSWTLWIPARFGFSDATEIFVFCSGMASALAFGAAFRDHGWWMGTGRIAYRVWQVYWCHIGMFLAILALLWLIDAQGWGTPGKTYIATVPVVPFFEDTGRALFGMLTLTWVPNYFDILPMYLVILAMVPAVMGAFMLGGGPAAAALVAGVWLAAQLGWLDLTSRPWDPKIPWFFSPFGWQLVFFTGFFLGMKWAPAPPVSRGLIWAAAAVLIVSVPFAWFRVYGGLYLPDDWLVQDWIEQGREATRDLWRKTEQGLLRWIHFLALAYLAWVAVGPGGRVLLEGIRPPRVPSRRVLQVCAVLAVATAPYAYVDEIRAWLPALDAALTRLLGEGARAVLGFDLFLPGERIGLLALVHIAALVPLVWRALGPRIRAWACGDAWLAVVPVVQKVGAQSLAVFLVSMVMGRVNGWWLDVIGREAWKTALVNLSGFAVLIATAYIVGWFRAQPWRRAPPRAAAPAGRPGAQPAE